MTMMNINTKMMSSGHMAFEVSCSVRAALCAMPGSRYTAQYPYVNTNGCKCGVCEREGVRVQYTCTCLICLLIFVHVILFPLHTVSSVKTREASLGLLPRDAWQTMSHVSYQLHHRSERHADLLARVTVANSDSAIDGSVKINSDNQGYTNFVDARVATPDGWLNFSEVSSVVIVHGKFLVSWLDRIPTCRWFVHTAAHATAAHVLV